MILPYEDWSTGLLTSFCREPKAAALCVGCCCCGLGYTYGLTQELMTKGRSGRWSECCFYTLACCCISSTCVGYSNRLRMRKSFHIQGGMCSDWIVHCMCQPCAVLQEYHSVKTKEWVQEEDLWLQMGVHHATVDFNEVRSNIIEQAASRFSRDGARSVNSMAGETRSVEEDRNVNCGGGGGKGAGHGDRAGCSEGEVESAGRSLAGETAAAADADADADAGADSGLQAQDEVRKRALTFQKSLLKMVDDRDRLENGTSWSNAMGAESH